MEIAKISLRYFKWHYGKALLSTFGFWETILDFLFNYFSMTSLVKNFFSPWKRLSENYPSRFDLSEYFNVFAVNLMMRISGMLIRFFALVLGLIVIGIYIVCLPIAFAVWIFLPIFDIALFTYGFILIFFA